MTSFAFSIPAEVPVCNCNPPPTYAHTPQPAVFSRCMKIDHLQLPPEGVYVLWKWKLNDDYFIDEESQCICEDETTLSQHTPEEEEDTTACKSDEEKNIGNHTVTFKCIGANKSADSQQCLKRVSELLASGIDVIVDIYPEPENAFDSRAIAFKAYVDNKLHTIGYVVREATEAVHDGITKKEITNVKFAWARYLLSWSRSGPGYYAGIDITIRGRWPVSVVQCASTQ